MKNSRLLNETQYYIVVIDESDYVLKQYPNLMTGKQIRSTLSKYTYFLDERTGFVFVISSELDPLEFTRLYTDFINYYISVREAHLPEYLERIIKRGYILAIADNPVVDGKYSQLENFLQEQGVSVIKKAMRPLVGEQRNTKAADLFVHKLYAHEDSLRFKDAGGVSELCKTLVLSAKQEQEV